MKWLSFLLILAATFLMWFSQTSLAMTPEEYSRQVMEKDLPRSLSWLEKLNAVDSPEATALPAIYAEALPAPQPNWQSGISIKGSIERLLLLIDGAQIFQTVQEAPVQFQVAKRRVQEVLQVAKDQTDQFKFGEKPAVIFQDWKSRAIDFTSFAQEIALVLKEIHTLLGKPDLEKAQVEAVDTTVAANEASPSESNQAESALATSDSSAVSASAAPTPSAVSAAANPLQKSATEQALESELPEYDQQRFFAFVESTEAGRVAPECLSARTWSTDQSPRCQSDDQPGCDRIYARQCKKLQ